MNGYPKTGLEDPGNLDLTIDRYQRANVPSGLPPKQDPHVRVLNFDEVFLGYDEG